MTTIGGVVFRLDGVLVDSVHSGYSVWYHEFLKHGLHLAIDYWGDLLERHPLAECDEHVARLLHQRSGSPAGDLGVVLDRIGRRRRRLELVQPLRPGIDGWLRDAAGLGARLFAVSDHPLDVLDDELRRLKIDQHFEARFSFAETTTIKGYGELVANACAPPESLVAIEDAPARVRAAREAGLRCVASPHKVSVHQLVTEPGTVIAEPPWVDLAGALSGLAPRDKDRRRQMGDKNAAVRIEASLGALALGDAIGKIVNKRSFNQLDADTTDLLKRFETDAGPPPPSVFTGCVTDDTVLLLALVDCVLADGRVRREAYERALRAVNPRGGRQIYKLKADTADLVVALDGNTNGCIPRCAAVGYTTPPTELGDLGYDVLKVATLTHGAPEALVAALLFATILAAAVDGEPVRSVRERLPELYAPLARLAGGGGDLCELVQVNVAKVDRAVSAGRYVDLLESSVGMAMAARSSAVAAICLGLSSFPFTETVAAMMRRHAHWDLDSTAAIYGALAGAFQPDEVPASWVERIERHCDRSFAGLSRSLASVRDR